MPLASTAPSKKLYTRVAIAGALLSFVVLLATAPRFGGDQNDYADRVADVMTGRSAAVPTLIEPGHLLWMPTLYALSSVMSTTGATAETAPSSGVLLASRIIATLSAVVAAVAVALLVLTCFGEVWLAVAASALLLSIHGMLNYSQAGVSYVPGLAASCIALVLSVAAMRQSSSALAVVAGVAAGLAVLFWLPFVLILPALFGAAWILAPVQPARSSAYLAWMISACALTGAIAYGNAALLAGIPPSQFSDWIQGAGHSIEGSGGVPRVVLGIARSFVFLGDDPGVVKRYLYGDPFYPVSARELATMSIWPRLMVFYGAALAVAVLLASPRRRSTLVLLMCAAIPCIAFGLTWQGGDIERYLPLYPFAVLCICAAIAAVKRRVAGGVVVTSLVILAANNIYSLSRPVIRAEQMSIARRTACNAIEPGSVLVIPNWHDPIVNVYRTVRTAGVLPEGIRILVAVTPMASGAEKWRVHAARRMLSADSAGRPIWIAKRALADSPARESGWLEGEDRRLHWSDFPGFFGSLSTVDECDTPDGFVLLRMNDRTRGLLEREAYTVVPRSASSTAVIEGL